MTKRAHPVRTFSAVLLIVAALVLTTAPPLHAYVDPGSGSMLVQLITGGVAGAAVILRLYWRRLKDKLTGRKPPSSDPPAPDAAGAPKDRP